MFISRIGSILSVAYLTYFSYIIYKMLNIVTQAVDRIDSIRETNINIYQFNEAFKQAYDHKDRLRFD
jgi:hypothetical protein